MEKTRPQIMIFFEATTNREQQETIAKHEMNWEYTASIIASMYNTAMGNKKKHKPKDFMPDFDKIRNQEKSLSNDELISIAKEKGLKVPKN